MLEDDYQTLYDLIQDKQVIPIIGFDLYDAAFKNEIEKAVASDENKGLHVPDALSFLAFKYNPDEYKRIVQKLNNNTNGFQIINILYHSLPQKKRSGFGVAISEKLLEFRSQANPIPACIAQLAMIKCFKFYINATFFNSLELAISKYRVPVADTDANAFYEVVDNDKENLKDIPYDNTRSGFSTDYFKKPLIYNWLGTHDKSHGKFFLADVDYIELLVKMIANENNTFLNLKNALKHAYLLFIGCDFPDWVLRFFLRFSIDEKMDKKEALEKNYLVERIDDEPSKAFLIGSSGITKFQEPPDKFIFRMYEGLRRRINSACVDSISFSNNKVFISYNHEDTAIAQHIKKQLESQFIDVWLDEKMLESGDSLSKEIQDGIHNSCAFIAIVTNNFNKYIGQKKYFKEEWNFVAENYNKESGKHKEVIRLVTDDFLKRDMDDTYLFPNAKKYFIENSDMLIKVEKITSPDYNLTDKFISALRELQYKKGLLGL